LVAFVQTLVLVLSRVEVSVLPPLGQNLKLPVSQWALAPPVEAGQAETHPLKQAAKLQVSLPIALPSEEAGQEAKHPWRQDVKRGASAQVAAAVPPQEEGQKELKYP
jgi:hypothetical protein